MKVKTDVFKDAVNKSIQGCSFNKLLPITSMIGMKTDNNKLCLCSTDKTNSLDIFINVEDVSDLDVTVDADTFSKLISKLTSDNIELSIENETLIVKANGTYKFPLVSDEDGLVKFADTETVEGDEYDVLLSKVLSVYKSNESALAKTEEQPYLTGYYCGNESVTTDATVITFNEDSITDESNPLLLSPQTMKLLALNTNDTIKMIRNGDKLQFRTDNVVVTTSTLEGIDEYPINESKRYLEEEFVSKCRISKDLLLGVLDRLLLFIEPYDKNGAYFTFDEKGIKIHSRKDSSVEFIEYVDSKNFEPFTCYVEIPLFQEQLQSVSDDNVDLSYGNENALRLDCGKITQIISLLDDEDEE